MQVFLTPEYLAICMEYAKGGDMFQYVKGKGGLQVGIPSMHSKLLCWPPQGLQQLRGSMEPEHLLCWCLCTWLARI